MATDVTHTVICVDCGPEAMGSPLAAMCEVARTRCEWGLHFGSRPKAGYSNTVSVVLSGTGVTTLPTSIPSPTSSYRGVQVVRGWTECTASTVRFWESLRRMAGGGEPCGDAGGEDGGENEMRDASDAWDAPARMRQLFGTLGKVRGDVLDTLVVALAQLPEFTLRASKLSVLLLTTTAPGAGDVDQIDTHGIGAHMRERGVEVTVGVVPAASEAEPRQRVWALWPWGKGQREGDGEGEGTGDGDSDGAAVWKAMRRAAAAAGGGSRCEPLGRVADAERMLRTATVKPAIRAKGDLQIAAGLAVEVEEYWYCAEKSQPDPGRFERVVVDDAVLGTSGTMLEPDRAVFSETLWEAPPTEARKDTVHAVPPELRVKVYRYGADLLPVDDEELLAYHAGPKGWKVLGFLDRGNVHVTRLVSGVSAVVASRGAILDAQRALRALVGALHAEGKVAVVRQAVARGEDKVEIGVLWPHQDCMEDPRLRAVLFYARLPFAGEDRKWTFPSFVKAGVTPEQVALAELLVDANILGGEGALPDVPPSHELPNLTGWRFHDHVLARACDGPEAECPGELPEWLQPRVMPERALPAKAQTSIANFAAGFTFVPPVQRAKRSRRGNARPAPDWRDN